MTSKTSKLFYCMHDATLDEKKKMLNSCVKYINDSENKIDDISVTSGVEGPQGIYAINTKEL